MSTPTNNGGPAFPLSDVEWTNARRHNNGMSLRDYFAAAAIQGMLASSKDIIGMSEANYATAAYLQADAMLAERNKGV